MKRCRVKIANLISVLFGCILISGCATIYETKVNQPGNNSRQYFLPKGLIALKLERKVAKAGVEVTASVKIAPDLKTKLYLHANHNFTYEDKLVVQTDSSGLLKAVNAKSDFKGGEILSKLGELATAAMQFDEVGERQVCKKDQSQDTFLIEVEFDPFDGVDVVKDVNDKLGEKCFKLNPKSSLVKAKQPKGTTKGILYRGITAYPFTISSTVTLVSKNFEAVLPDKSSLEIFEYDRGVFVSRNIDLTFENGFLVKSDLTYPSEVLGFITLPLSIVKSISDATIGRFGMRTTEAQNETKYIEAIQARDKARNPSE